MPGDPRECRERAARCLELAAETANEGVKQMLLSIAKQWETLAMELERAKRVLNDEKGAIKIAFKKPRRRKLAAQKRNRKKKAPAAILKSKRANGAASVW